MIFSVIIPTHHRTKTLQLLLASLEQQKLSIQDFEVIVVPSPQDQSLSYLTDYQKNTSLNLTVLDSKNDIYQGKSASYKRNMGAAVARAPWLAFIDDDCTADPSWLSTATELTTTPSVYGIEGHTHIPKPETITLTYKGLLMLSHSQGYQTCNMFYKKKEFLDFGGFDLNFPFYLEDTDMAWTFLDHKKNIIYSKESIVYHPVPAPETYRLMTGAYRVRKIPYLFKKHPELFKKNNMRALPRSFFPYFFLAICTMIASFYHIFWSLFFLTLLFIILPILHSAKLFYNCSFEWREVFSVIVYLPLIPFISLFQLIRGNMENRTFIL